MKLFLFIFFSVVVISSFGQDNLKTKNISFKFITYNGMKDVKVKLRLKVPDNFIEIIKNGPGMDGEVDYQIIYPDSSIIYLSNEFLISYYLNIKNLINIGVNSYTYKSINDTVINEGKNEKDLYWKEIACTGLVRGYINVSPRNKPLFNESIKIIRKKEK